MMQRVMKAKELNVSEAKSGKILGKMNPQAQRKRQNVAGHSLILWSQERLRSE